MSDGSYERYRRVSIDSLKTAVKSVSNVHRPNGSPNVFLFSLPRSGSTWLMELIWTQPGFKCCDEPTDLRKARIRKHLSMNTWHEMYTDEATINLASYFSDLESGKLGFMNPSPLRRYYRPRTNRIVFKIIHGCEDRIDWFGDTFNGKIVYLVRHPIAVSLSRDEVPSLPAMIESPYRRHFTADQLRFAEHINTFGTKLQRGVVSWCLQVSVQLRQASPDWAIVSYEEMIDNPHGVVQYLADTLQLPDPERMRRDLSVPSNSTHKSDNETRRALDRGEEDQRHWLIEKWRKRVDREDERQLMDMLSRFDLDIYRAGELFPVGSSVWVGSGLKLREEGITVAGGHVQPASELSTSRRQ